MLEASSYFFACKQGDTLRCCSLFGELFVHVFGLTTCARSKVCGHGEVERNFGATCGVFFHFKSALKCTLCAIEALCLERDETTRHMQVWIMRPECQRMFK